MPDFVPLMEIAETLGVFPATGKRNTRPNEGAITTAEALRRIDSKAARWIAADAIREFAGVPVQKRLRKQTGAFLDKLRGKGPRIP